MRVTVISNANPSLGVNQFKNKPFMSHNCIRFKTLFIKSNISNIDVIIFVITDAITLYYLQLNRTIKNKFWQAEPFEILKETWPRPQIR